MWRSSGNFFTDKKFEHEFFNIQFLLKLGHVLHEVPNHTMVATIIKNQCANGPTAGPAVIAALYTQKHTSMLYPSRTRLLAMNGFMKQRLKSQSDSSSCVRTVAVAGSMQKQP